MNRQETLEANSLEDCFQCGGIGFVPSSEYGNYPDHPCYKCGNTGMLPLGSLDREHSQIESTEYHYVCSGAIPDMPYWDD